MHEQNIGEIVRKMEADYKSGSTTISAHVNFSLRENIERIEAYLFSKHISGETDALGREKPFFNIVTAARNIWYRATDIDRANIRIKATKLSDTIAALLATVHLQEWMRRTAFGSFLNDWGRALATYGSAVVKFVEKDGELHASVVPWNRLICDAVDFENNPKIERLYLTPAQLRKNKLYDSEQVKNLLTTRESRKDLNDQNRDTKADYIPLYEVHGEFSIAQLKRAKGEEVLEGDEDIYTQQIHVISFVQGKEKKDEYEEFTLYCGKEDDPYMITHLIKEDGRVQGIGAVEHLFEAQWMVNHSQKLIKDQLDLASKIVFQTADETFLGRNVLTDLEQGHVLIHKTNNPLTQLQNNSHDVTSLQSFAQAWQVVGQGITNTPDNQRGDTPPSGTAWHTVELISQKSDSLFELMTENKGLHVEEMLRHKIIPHIKKKLDTKEEILATLDAQGIKQIDAIYIPNQAVRLYNEDFKTRTFNRETNIPTFPEVQDELEGQVRQGLANMGNQRSFKPSDISEKTWKEAFKDLEWEVECEITGESSDKKALLDSLNTMFKTIVAMQGRPMTPQEKFVFMQIVETSGAVSPVALAQLEALPEPQPLPTPVDGGSGGGLPRI